MLNVKWFQSVNENVLSGLVFKTVCLILQLPLWIPSTFPPSSIVPTPLNISLWIPGISLPPRSLLPNIALHLETINSLWIPGMRPSTPPPPTSKAPTPGQNWKYSPPLPCHSPHPMKHSAWIIGISTPPPQIDLIPETVPNYLCCFSPPSQTVSYQLRIMVNNHQ